MGIAIIILVVVLIYFTVNKGLLKKSEISNEESAYDIASKRLASGEITKEQFIEIRNELDEWINS